MHRSVSLSVARVGVGEKVGPRSSKGSIFVDEIEVGRLGRV